ncbi:hypothetical protein EDC38_2569 [Marinimicrobium koreense]|uniref:Inner membrane protein YejM n=1 Tax=Marinimicrobium koreense TaxID=306545 RepID=A0A3N1P0D4_9GAMM|nr:DUF3413 domain-containing protein [Marinimicrobium koreense]ROQ18346.1 hypothetical protein EDC38_2569 [Marinimicrobium koreense]
MPSLFRYRRPLRERVRWAGWFIVANSLIALLIGFRYLPWMTVADTTTGLYVALAMIAQFSLLAWLFGLPLLLLTLILPQSLLRPTAIVIGTAGVALLLLDTVVYHQFRFHLSGFVFELIVGGGTEIFSFSWQTWAVGGIAIVALALLQWSLARRFWILTPRRYLWVPLTLLVTSQLLAHGWNAWADAHYDHRITRVARHLPLYHAATAKRFFARHGWVDPQAVREAAVVEQMSAPDGRGALNYPTAALQCTTPEQLPNILVIAVDSLRWDMLDPRWMPNTTRFAESAQVFTDHYSNGNATKPGIFTLFYGLPASYWDAFSAHQVPPVLIQRMQSLGYQSQILSSATLVSPAFDRNVFSSIKELRLKTPGDTSWQRDQQITQDWLDFLDRRSSHDNSSPFFGFLFYDAPHSYQVPPDYPRIEPYWESVNQLALDDEFDPEPYFNVYKTTVRFVDDQIHRVLADLSKRQLMEDTLVVITSDHGQEFNDNGMNYWGHGSNFSRYQLQVPLVIHWPGKAPSVVEHRTEHFDLAPTLLTDVLGCSQSATESYSSGEHLYTPHDKKWSIAHSYMNAAFLTEELQLVSYPSGGMEMLSTQLQPIDDAPLPMELIKRALKEQSRFYP